MLYHDTDAGVAQLVEQLICNQQVAGSTPVASSIFSMAYFTVTVRLIPKRRGALSFFLDYPITRQLSRCTNVIAQGW